MCFSDLPGSKQLNGASAWLVIFLPTLYRQDAHRARFQAQQPPTAAHKINGHASRKDANLIHAPGRARARAALPRGGSDGILRADGAPGRIPAPRRFRPQREVAAPGEASFVGNTVTHVADA